jgi:hypothetical protein
MKKLIITLGVILTSLSSFGQMTINRTITPSTGPYKVGDTLTVKYIVDKGTNPATTPRYVWLRYQYNNKSLLLLPNTTIFNQGTSVQTYSTEWANYKFTPSTANNIAATSLYAQYLASPWAFTNNSDWNVGQLTLQRTDATINGELATQKFIIKDNVSYTDIHNLILAYAIDATSANISPITTSGDVVSLGNVTGGSSSFKVKVAFPSSYTTINEHNVQLMRLKNDGSGQIDWSQQPIAQATLDASGEATFTTLKIGDSLGVFVAPTMNKAWMNNIVTVSDAYKAFLAISQVDINGNSTYFTYPNLEKKVGLVTKNKSVFSESDSYYLFAHVMGINVDSNAMIPTNTSTSVRWYSGLLNQSWLNGTPTNKVLITSNTQTANAVFAWGGDLNWSHSTDPAVVASNIANNTNVTNSLNKTSFGMMNIKTSSVGEMSVGSYSAKQYEKATLSVSSALQNGKVVLTANLTKADLAGLEVIMNYDDSKLTLDNVIFDAGSTITNFSTHADGRLTFGSIDQIKTARIKTGTPYKLIFTPKVSLANTAGLFYFVLADAVDASGNKIDLVVE